MLEDNSRISTVYPEIIKSWATARQARPVRLRRFDDETPEERVAFRFPSDTYPDEDDLTWEEFFDIFDTEELEFVFEDIADEAVQEPEGNVYQFQPRRLA